MPLAKIFATIKSKKTGKPIGGPGYSARLYDKDLVRDDFLGEADIAEDGVAAIIFNLEDAASEDSPLETDPDLYFVVLKNDKVVGKTKVTRDVDFLKRDPVTGMRKSLTQDLGVLEM